MHKTYVGPISDRYRQTPADMPPSSRYRPDVGMFAGANMALLTSHNITPHQTSYIYFHIKSITYNNRHTGYINELLSHFVIVYTK